MNYPHTVIVQFRTLYGDGIGDLATLEFRHSIEQSLGALLQSKHLGICDGGQQGAGTAEAFFFVSDIAKSVQVIKDELSRRELLSFCKIASAIDDDAEFVTEYSQHGNFDMWNW